MFKVCMGFHKFNFVTAINKTFQIYISLVSVPSTERNTIHKTGVSKQKVLYHGNFFSYRY